MDVSKIIIIKILIGWALLGTVTGVTYGWWLLGLFDAKMLKNKKNLKASVVDPNTLNLDPDPRFWLNLDPIQGSTINFERKNSK